MGVTPLTEILSGPFDERYGVPAINVFNDLTLEAVLAAAVENASPLIVQTSVKTVKSMGSDVLYALWTAMTAGIEVPVSLHLDHCPEREVITECLRRGWNSVLFDASRLPVEENMRQTVEVVAEARAYGAAVEGEIESITGVEDGVGSDTAARQQDLAVALEFLRTTGVDVFAPHDRERPRVVQTGAGARCPARVRSCGGPPGSDRAARRQRTVRRAVP